MTCVNCQLSKNYKTRLGRTTWSFLELLVEGSPFVFDIIDSNNMNTFITYLSYVYPCGECRPGFIDYVDKNPPDIKSRKDLYNYFNNLKKFIHYNK